MSKTVSVLLIFAFTFLLYSSFLSKSYLFDSIDYTIMAETGYNLFWQKHLLQHSLQKIFYDLWKLLGWNKGAIIPLQILNAILGALGIATFFLLIDNIVKNKKVALLGGLCLAFSSGYWRFSSEVEVIIAPIPFLIITLLLLFKIKQTDSYANFICMGLSHGIGTLLYKPHVIFWPIIVFGIFLLYKSGKIKKILIYSIIFSITILIPYIVIGIFYYKLSFKNLIHWFIREDSSVFLIGFSLKSKNILHTTTGTISVFIKNIMAGNLFNFIYFGLLLCLFVYTRKLLLRFRKIVALCICFVFIYMLLFMWFADNNQYLIPLLIPFWILVSLVFHELDKSNSQIFKKIPVIMVLPLFFINFTSSILPTSNPKNNLVLQRSLFIKNNSKEGDLIIFVGAGKSVKDSMYIPYFAKREPFSFYRFYTWHNHITVKYYDTDLLIALEERINYKLNTGNHAYAYSDIFDVDKPYPTLYNFKWPINTKKIPEFIYANYKVNDSLRFNNEIIYEIRKK